MLTSFVNAGSKKHEKKIKPVKSLEEYGKKQKLYYETSQQSINLEQAAKTF